MHSSLYILLLTLLPSIFFFFFFNDTATTEIYTLSLHDALPISLAGNARCDRESRGRGGRVAARGRGLPGSGAGWDDRSEEHTSELQSQSNLVCRLLLEKKKKDVNDKNSSILKSRH